MPSRKLLMCAISLHRGAGAEIHTPCPLGHLVLRKMLVAPSGVRASYHASSCVVVRGVEAKSTRDLMARSTNPLPSTMQTRAGSTPALRVSSRFVVKQTPAISARPAPFVVCLAIAGFAARNTVRT